MNTHPAHRGDVVHVHPGVTVSGHHLGGMHLTVHAVHPDTGLHPDEIAATEWTGGRPVVLHLADVDVLTPGGSR